jgi:hypothetical protein
MTDIKIPDEVVSAAHRAFYGRKLLGFREALAAGLAAWPGVHLGHQCTGCGGDPQVILPLQEPRNEALKDG